MRRVIDFFGAAVGLLLVSPILLVLALIIFLQDGGHPIYAGARIGRDGKPFRMFKLRTMSVGADRNQVDTTALGDPRITRIGSVVRTLKADELPQLWNVLVGDMSLVGPRPNVTREVNLYTDVERRMLSVSPGVTDLSSIAFSDLAERLGPVEDANLAYNQLIRPWKSRLALLYVDHGTVELYLAIIVLTIVNAVDKSTARRAIARIITRLGADETFVGVVTGEQPLVPTPPPGASEVVRSR